MAFNSAPTGVTNQGDVSKDVTLNNQPEDSISELSWSPVANYLAVASWDKVVRIYDISHSPPGRGESIILAPWSCSELWMVFRWDEGCWCRH